MFGFLQGPEAEICSQGSNLQHRQTEKGLKIAAFSTEKVEKTHVKMIALLEAVQQKYNLSYVPNIHGVVYSLGLILLWDAWYEKQEKPF